MSEGHNGAAQGLGPRGVKVIGSVGIGAMRDVMHMACRVIERGNQACWVPGCMLVSGRQGAHQRDSRGRHWQMQGTIPNASHSKYNSGWG